MPSPERVCRVCGGEPLPTSAGQGRICRECFRETAASQSRAWRAANPEKLVAKRRAYSKTPNGIAIRRKAQARYYASHRESRLASQRIRYLAKREARAALKLYQLREQGIIA